MPIKRMLRLLIASALAVLLLAGMALLTPSVRAYEGGGDISELTWEQNSQHVVYKDVHGNRVDPIRYAKQQGWTACRLRILVHPKGNDLSQGLGYDLALAKQIKAAHLKLILDIFYSDGWADPGKQPAPAAWASQSYPQLRQTVYTYTKSVLLAFRNNNTLPDYVQIGNEISNGMLWPIGTLANKPQFIGLIQSGIAGVRAVSSQPKIILHCNNGAHPDLVTWFYTTIASHCAYDVVGLSYYPDNGTTLQDLKSAMNAYDGKFGNRPIMLVEYGYKHGYGVSAGKGYLNTPEGQAQCTAAVSQIMRSHRQGAGVIYWGAVIVTGGWGSESLFDYTTDRAEPAFLALGSRR